MNKRIKMLMLAAGSAVLIAGCTKSNIVQPDQMVLEPDFNKYNDIVIDEDQLHEDVDDIYVNEKDYPMSFAIDFSLNLDEEYVDIIAVVKDGTSLEDAAYYATVAIKGVNDEVAVQDFSYGTSSEDTFGGLYQDNDIHLKVYFQSEYEAEGKPLYEVTIPKDTEMEIVIE